MGWREVKRRTPGGRVTIIYKRTRPNPPRCAWCKRPLQGVVRIHPTYLRRINKTQKRVSRPFGGYLCHECLRKLMKMKAREEAKMMISSGLKT